MVKPKQFAINAIKLYQVNLFPYNFQEQLIIQSKQVYQILILKEKLNHLKKEKEINQDSMKILNRLKIGSIKKNQKHHHHLKNCLENLQMKSKINTQTNQLKLPRTIFQDLINASLHQQHNKFKNIKHLFYMQLVQNL